jgi:hypothetical protein
MDSEIKQSRQQKITTVMLMCGFGFISVAAAEQFSWPLRSANRVSA